MTGLPTLAEQFLRHLVGTQALSPEGAERVSQAAAQSSHPLDTVLTELGLLRESEFVAQAARFCDLPHAAEPRVDADLAGKIGTAFLEDHAVLPLSLEGGILAVAVADPFARSALEALAFLFDGAVAVRMAPRSGIQAEFARLRSAASDPASQDSSSESIANPDDLDRLRDFAREAPVVRFVARTIDEAVERGATDIHIEPQEDRVRIRLRRDGLLHETEGAPRAMHMGIVTRIKIMAQLNIAERRLPQDGRMRVTVRGQTVELRVSVIPSVHGESLVLRILDRSGVSLDLDALGFDAEARSRLLEMASAANGIILITGPTGSGKTTTLYALLKQRATGEAKIFTVEDPVEYRLPGVTQLQVEPAIGLDFAGALRSILRHDPDVILVGEIRDRETAEIAVRAALTGHLVLSTLHTNDAAGAYTRLRDIGIEDYLLGSTVRGVVAQRLLRKLCGCAGGNEGADRSTTGDPSCKICGGSGYAGRTAAFEILPTTQSISALVRSGAGEREISAASQQEGMVGLLAHARMLAAKGVTTAAEIGRVMETGSV